MPDVVVQRVAGAQALLLERAERLKRLLKRAENRKVPEKFVEGAELVQQLIEGESELINNMTIDAPRTRLEQIRNLHLATGDASQSVEEGMKTTTTAIDSMLDLLEDMLSQQR